MHKKGLTLTNALARAEQDEALFNSALDFLAPTDLAAIEFYTDDAHAARYGQLIRDHKFEPVFISAIDQKRNGDCRICAEDEGQRVRSVDFLKRSLEKAFSSGAKRIIIHSGTYPADPINEVVCMHAVEKSLREISEFAGNGIRLLLEPCDRSVDLRLLLGPSMQVYTLMKKLSLPNIGLTMDVAHITELFEDPGTALRLCKPYCDHVHIANCVLDPASELFGDKHPLFGVENGCYSIDDGNMMYQDAVKLYENEDMYISVEVLDQKTDPMSFLKSVVENAPWFFIKR